MKKLGEHGLMASVRLRELALEAIQIIATAAIAMSLKTRSFASRPQPKRSVGGGIYQCDRVLIALRWN